MLAATAIECVRASGTVALAVAGLAPASMGNESFNRPCKGAFRTGRPFESVEVHDRRRSRTPGRHAEAVGTATSGAPSWATHRADPAALKENSADPESAARCRLLADRSIASCAGDPSGPCPDATTRSGSPVVRWRGPPAGAGQFALGGHRRRRDGRTPQVPGSSAPRLAEQDIPLLARAAATDGAETNRDGYTWAGRPDGEHLAGRLHRAGDDLAVLPDLGQVFHQLPATAAVTPLSSASVMGPPLRQWLPVGTDHRGADDRCRPGRPRWGSRRGPRGAKRRWRARGACAQRSLPAGLSSWRRGPRPTTWSTADRLPQRGLPGKARSCPRRPPGPRPGTWPPSCGTPPGSRHRSRSTR